MANRAEQETIVRWDAEERIAHIFSANPTDCRRLKALCKEFPDTYKLTRETKSEIFVDAPVDRIAFRKPPKPKSEAQINAAKMSFSKNGQKQTNTSSVFDLTN